MTRRYRRVLSGFIPFHRSPAACKQNPNKRPGFDTTAYLGVGKREEIRRFVNGESDSAAEYIPAASTPDPVDAVFVDHEISPSQARHLENEVGCPVMDRTMVILEIFHRNARSPAARAGGNRPSGLYGTAPAVVPVSTPRTPRWNCMPTFSMRQASWTNSKASPASSARTSMACRATPRASRSSAKPGRYPPCRRWANTAWYRCGRGRRWGGG
jgi:hypothetical protein